MRQLLFTPEARFAELNVTDLTSDHFTFHVQQLTEAGLIIKRETGKYALTNQGKEFTNRFDTDTKQVILEKQAKLGICLCCVKEEGGQTYYALQQRLKQPYYGYWGFMTGKIKWGESVQETAHRELEEEMGLKADLELITIKHKIDTSPDGTLLEDKYFFIFRGTNPQGTLIESFEGGKNAWMTRKEIEALPVVFHDLEETLNDFDRTSLKFIESNYMIENY